MGKSKGAANVGGWRCHRCLSTMMFSRHSVVWSLRRASKLSQCQQPGFQQLTQRTIGCGPLGCPLEFIEADGVVAFENDRSIGAEKDIPSDGDHTARQCCMSCAGDFSCGRPVRNGGRAL